MIESQPRTPPSTDLIRHEVRDGVFHLRLARPGGNALDLEVARALRDVTADIHRSDVGSVLLGAEGKNFCVGGDVTYFAREDRAIHEGVGELVATLHQTIKLLDALHVPVVSAVRGWCVGAGLGLALVADVVIAAQTSRFRSAYTAIGFTPDLGASWHVPRLIGAARAHDFLLTNRVLDGQTACDWGLVSRVVDEAALDEEAHACAAELATGPRRAHAGVRRLLRGETRPGFNERLDLEARLVTEASESDEGREGIQAFLSRRPADFGASRLSDADPRSGS